MHLLMLTGRQSKRVSFLWLVPPKVTNHTETGPHRSYRDITARESREGACSYGFDILGPYGIKIPMKSNLCECVLEKQLSWVYFFIWALYAEFWPHQLLMLTWGFIPTVKSCGSIIMCFFFFSTDRELIN